MKWPLYAKNFHHKSEYEAENMDLWSLTVRANLYPTDAKYLARKECHSCLFSPHWRTYGERV